MVGILLHFRAVWCGRDSVTLPKELLDKFNISRGVKQRALKSLEEAGLVSIVQETGRSPLITLRKCNCQQNSYIHKQEWPKSGSFTSIILSN